MSTSRWGSLLQQAVAGVESRLDNILADEDANSGTASSRMQNTAQPGRREGTMVFTGTSLSKDPPRPSSVGKNPDRLQERLAKAVVSRNSSQTAIWLSGPSRTASPSLSIDSLRSSTEENPTDVTVGMNGQLDEPEIPSVISRSDKISAGIEHSLHSDRAYTDSHDHRLGSLSTEFQDEMPNGSRLVLSSRDGEPDVLISEQHCHSMNEMCSDNETAELRRQEETHQYLERINALQAKLQYLIKEAVERATKEAVKADNSSVEVELAKKDEKIASLIEEGEKLSENELRLVNTIRKLRIKTAEDEKRINESKQLMEDSDKSGNVAKERAREAEASESDGRGRPKALEKFERELVKARTENCSQSTMIQGLRDELADTNRLRGAEDIEKYKNLFETERRHALELKDDLSNAKIERELGNERHRMQIGDLQEKFEREKERAKAAEVELRSELNELESQLETFRARTEEMYSGSSSDSQVKMLRQIETLQTQYSVATDNWRSIEGSLLVRITGLERERDDLSKKEGDIRRKAREAAAKSRKFEDKVEEAMMRIKSMEQELANKSSRLLILEDTLRKAEKASEMERRSWQMKLQEKVEALQKENSRHTPEIPYPQPRNGSIILPSQRTSTMDALGRRQYGGSGLGLVSATTPHNDLPPTRRPSIQPSQISGSGISQRQDSVKTTPQLLSRRGTPEMSMSQTENQDDFLDDVITPATSERTINDMVSVSTTGAGPSVQLVERMSAAVRRLENEKAAAWDELDRLRVQRDEAREQVVKFMRDAEENQVANTRIADLETEVSTINQRYQTTLEMLGEKSELVDELKADVADIKEMYKELVENTMK